MSVDLQSADVYDKINLYICAGYGVRMPLSILLHIADFTVSVRRKPVLNGYFDMVRKVTCNSNITLSVTWK